MARVLGFVVRRLVASAVMVFILVTAVFFLSRLSPINPIEFYLGRHATPTLVHELDSRYGLNLPLFQQYLNYLSNLIHGNLGYSFANGTFARPVWPIIRSGAPETLRLGFWGLIVGLVIGLPFGLLCALKQNTFFDHFNQLWMMLLYVIPVFIIGPVSQLVFGVDLPNWTSGWGVFHFVGLPITGWGASGWIDSIPLPFGWHIPIPGVLPNPRKSSLPFGLDSTTLDEMVLPVAIYGVGLAAFFGKSMRSFVLEVMRQDYIRTARAKGLKGRIVIFRHIAKNTLIPLASIIGPTIAFLIVGAFVIENLFGIPGIGFLTVQAVQGSDYATIQATTLLLVIFVVVMNLLTDIFYAVVDPRISL
jgi:ABC-type dipeptide/oligopeptide/nickel transport system permease component